MLVKKQIVHVTILATFGLGIIILFATLLGLTVNREVAQNEYVVQYNTYKMEFDKILEQGRYTTDVGVDWYPFARTLRHLKVGEIDCLSKDKIQLTLAVNLQVLMNRDELIPIIMVQFGGAKRHDKFLNFYTKSSIINTCLEFNAVEYYTTRSTVDNLMLSNLKKDINGKGLGIAVDFFQLVNIALPSDLNNVIIEKQNVQQDYVTATNDRENQIIDATTILLKAEQQALITLIKANNTAAIVTNQASQTERIILTDWDNRAIAYEDIVQRLQLSDVEFVDYLDSEILRQVNKAYT